MESDGLPTSPPPTHTPQVQRRCERLDLYTKALIEQMPQLPEQHVAKLVEFFRATYRPLQPNPKLPAQSFQIAPALGASYDSAPVTKSDPAIARTMTSTSFVDPLLFALASRNTAADVRYWSVLRHS